MTKEEIIKLADKIVSGTATEEEILLYNHMCNFIESSSVASGLMEKEDKQALEASIKKAIFNGAGIGNRADRGKVHRMNWYRWTAAAAVFVLIAGLGYLYFQMPKKHTFDSGVAQQKAQKQINNDILPGGDKAVLTLADGSTIDLDNAQNGALTRQGDTKVIKQGGKLSYEPGNTGKNEIVYNTISTPRGGQYHVELPDGSQVWLNAASSLHLPAAFAGKERRVEIKGEAYFEVAKNKSMPFIVSVNGAEVQVLGTHFNVKAYQEEALVKTTLLEGSVKFVSGSIARVLKPGQQSQLTKGRDVKVNSGVDVEEAVAWKNGLFMFKGAPIEEVMNQLSRWYDVKVVYNKKVNYLYYVEITRSSKLSEVLKVLELTGDISFEVVGKEVIVK